MAVVSTSPLLNVKLRSRLLADRIPDEFKQEMLAKPNDDIIDRMAVPSNH